MAFTKLSITGNRRESTGGRDPAHPSTDIDIWAIFRALRDSRSLFGLRPGHIQTLQAMLSFLKPGHGETVFASNTEICRRIGGIDERTLRRHIDRFVELGFMQRNDSPNRKRYRVRSSDGQCISFGLSLAPLLDRADELLASAREMEDRRRDSIFLRKKILTRLACLEELIPDHSFLSETRKMLRRKLSLAEYRALLTSTEAECRRLSTAVDIPETRELPANDGQNVRHLSRSEKDEQELEDTAETTDIQALTSICEEATSFAVEPLRNWQDVEAHARNLAPMIGIHANIFEKAKSAVGAHKASCAIFIMLQLGNRIRNFGAYFHSITLGRRQETFLPSALLKSLAAAQAAPA